MYGIYTPGFPTTLCLNLGGLSCYMGDISIIPPGLRVRHANGQGGAPALTLPFPSPRALFPGNSVPPLFDLCAHFVLCTWEGRCRKTVQTTKIGSEVNPFKNGLIWVCNPLSSRETEKIKFSLLVLLLLLFLPLPSSSKNSSVLRFMSPLKV